MFSINPKRSIVGLAVVAGLLAAAGPASAQGGGADFTRFVDDVPTLSGDGVPAPKVPAQSGADRSLELLDYDGSTLAATDSSQPEGIIAILIGVVQPNDGPARSGEIVTDNKDPDKLSASGLKAGSNEVLMETVTAKTRPEVAGEVLPGSASGARSLVVDKDLHQPDM
jgi:hypothetical protein